MELFKIIAWYFIFGISMACIQGREFIRLAQIPGQLETMLNQSISDIKGAIFIGAKKPNPSIQCQLRASGSLGIDLPASVRICEVTEPMWSLNFSGYPHVRALYVPTLGKIFLHQGRWCRKTLIHEALHSLSVFNVRTDLNSFLFLREGLTEFLTGYILFKRYTGCYDAWRQKTYPDCRIAGYERNVRLWCAFCNFVSIKPVSRMYFWDPASDWQTSYNEFIDAIHSAGHVGFRDIMAVQPPVTLEEAFVQECIDNFGPKFKDIYESRIRGLDFSQVLP